MQTGEAFVANRGDFGKLDLTGRYIVPPLFDSFQSFIGERSLVIEGGRGSGKTTLLGYLSYRTQFGESYGKNSRSDIGVCLRADSQFLRTMTGLDHDEDYWLKVFDHYLALYFLREILNAIELILRKKSPNDPLVMDLAVLKGFDAGFPDNYKDFVTYVKLSQNRMYGWLQNGAHSDEHPVFLPCRHILAAFMEIVRESIPELSQSRLLLFIDEYENLLAYQQRLINTGIKHSGQHGIVFNIAVKRNGMPIKETIKGGERLQVTHDYKLISIEDHLLGSHFSTFSAELLLSRLYSDSSHMKSIIGLVELSDPRPETLKVRLGNDYKKRVISEARRLLPRPSHDELGSYAISNPTLLRQLQLWIKRGLESRNEKLLMESFILPDYPSASVVCGAILMQKKGVTDASMLLEELGKHSKGEKSNFTTGKEWIHNFFLGSFIRLHRSPNTPIIAYAGFDNYVSLANQNVRNFIELCHWAFMNSEQEEGGSGHMIKPITPLLQAQASRKAANELFREVSGSGDFSTRLQSLANGLGQIFKAKQESLTQSEPESSHFALPGGCDEDASKLLVEAVKWSVLIPSSETKTKDPRIEFEEYRLNPIFSPHFRISPNKGKKTEFTPTVFNTLCSGDRSAISDIISSFSVPEFDTGTQHAIDFES
tara:strand:+ start:5933 stop:7894 length:1962 start_codon:yes stop_codon:yes gene_type:complete